MNDAATRAALAALLQRKILPTQAVRIEGGSISRCLRYDTEAGAVFVKVAEPDKLPRFEAEAAGLHELRATNAIRAPQVLAVGAAFEQALLVIEWLELRPPTPSSDELLGEQLAEQHRATKPLFGFKSHNFIGSTQQLNWWGRVWINFWRDHRLEAQLNLAIERGATGNAVEQLSLLSAMLDGFFVSHAPEPSLLHGDLWSGNYAADKDGRPIVFDPAVYYGDRECDIAMTKLFGGFGDRFYSAYQNAWPLAEGWQQRIELYNLYHVLNHFNLFGGGYLVQAEAMAGRLLAELGH